MRSSSEKIAYLILLFALISFCPIFLTSNLFASSKLNTVLIVGPGTRTFFWNVRYVRE
jgi:hypothetical protein